MRGQGLGVCTGKVELPATVSVCSPVSFPEAQAQPGGMKEQAQDLGIRDLGCLSTSWLCDVGQVTLLSQASVYTSVKGATSSTTHPSLAPSLALVSFPGLHTHLRVHSSMTHSPPSRAGTMCLSYHCVIPRCSTQGPIWQMKLHEKFYSECHFPHDRNSSNSY